MCHVARPRPQRARWSSTSKFRCRERGRANRHHSLVATLLCDPHRAEPAAPERNIGWYIQSAHNGSVEAMYYVALCYLHGYGVEPDLAESRRWARRCELVLNAQSLSA